MITNRRRARVLLAVCGAAAVAVAVSGCGSDPSDAPKDSRTFAFGGKELTIDSDNSDVSVRPADVTGITVTRQVSGWVFLGTGPKASWTLDGATLKLRVTCSALASDCSSRHTVLVPRGVSVNVDDDNGRIDASGFTTPLSLRTDNGRATVSDTTGSLELHSDNGSARVENVSGPMRLGTDNGEIVAEGVSAKQVTARSDNGSVRLTFTAVPDRLDVSTGNGEVRVGLPTSGTAYAVDAQSHNGAVDIGVPRDDSSSHTLKARSSNGKISVHAAN